jgi:hypothetical protein
MSDYEILHVFADRGAEADTLQHYGDVLRLSIDVTPNESSDAIQADATAPPLADSASFDIGWFHPPCGFVSPMSETGEGSRDDWPNLIPEARTMARRYCDEWVIENKPSEHIDSEVVLSGEMFALGIEYERAFETSFSVPQPPRHDRLGPDPETSPFYYTERSAGWWLGQKGCADDYPTPHVAKNTIPAAYINHIMAAYSECVNSTDIDYSDYDQRRETQRRREANESIGRWIGDDE